METPETTINHTRLLHPPAPTDFYFILFFYTISNSLFLLISLRGFSYLFVSILQKEKKETKRLAWGYFFILHPPCAQLLGAELQARIRSMKPEELSK